MKHKGEQGITLVELVISVLLLGVLGVATFNTLNLSKKFTDNKTDEILQLLSQYGASKLISRDIDGSLPSFNYLRTLDDSNRPFFVWATNELCQSGQSICKREIKLIMPPTSTSSAFFYLIVKRGNPGELEKFIVNPEDSFPKPSRVYVGVNVPSNSISKKNRPISPWAAGRLLLLSTIGSFNDCNNLISGTAGGGSCPTSCIAAGCDFAATRPVKFLGYVDNQERDLVGFTNIDNSISLSRSYRFCQQTTSHICTSEASTSIIDSAEKLMRNMPYINGLDTRTFLTPVELVRYYLKRSSTRDPAAKVQLIREKGFLRNGALSWGAPVVMITGVESFNLRRPNISEPNIEYDIKLVSIRKR